MTLKLFFIYNFPGSDLERCPVSRLLQFHDRYLEYLMVARELELDPNFNIESKRLGSLTYEERQAIIEVICSHISHEHLHTDSQKIPIVFICM